MLVLLVGSAVALLSWLLVLAAPHEPYRTRERLEADAEARDDLSSVTAVIPARDEADSLPRALAALALQGRGLDVIVVDDQSSDDTRGAALRAAPAGLAVRVVEGRELPAGWAGKLWALEQGLRLVERPYVLLLDADIELAPRFVPALLAKAVESEATLVSVMAELHCKTFWEHLLSPAFVFFFKLLYPFSWSNDSGKRSAAAAGGCMLVRAEVLRAIGGFASVRGALIDDCTLAAALKRHRPPIWLGMSHSVKSLRVYATLDGFWSMVSRSAFTQLRYSTALLLAATVLMALTLLVPPVAAVTGLAAADLRLTLTAGVAWLAMAAAYWPVVSFYRLPAPWAATLPLAAALFLAMTWSSAVSYWRGTRATWKARDYVR